LWFGDLESSKFKLSILSLPGGTKGSQHTGNISKKNFGALGKFFQQKQVMSWTRFVINHFIDGFDKSTWVNGGNYPWCPIFGDRKRLPARRFTHFCGWPIELLQRCNLAALVDFAEPAADEGCCHTSLEVWFLYDVVSLYYEPKTWTVKFRNSDTFETLVTSTLKIWNWTETMKPWKSETETPKLWNDETLKLWNTETLNFWNYQTLNPETLNHWNSETLKL